jgi:hypothetical protein
VARSSGDDGDTFRVVLSMSSGDIVPMTTYFTAGYQKKAKTAALICAFLELKSSAEHADASRDGLVGQ